MSHYLKKILVSLLILMMPYISKAMETDDYNGSAVSVRKVSFVEEDQKDVQFFTKHSISSLVVNLKDSQKYWTSYLSSSVMSGAQKMYDILDYTTRNPHKGIIIGLYLTYQVTATAAACWCYCTNPLVDGQCIGLTLEPKDCEYMCYKVLGPETYNISCK